ncbi:hypothetical protein Mal15_07160 [Stieleria maiorica]|uniref:Uncharacterized protein n=1 Tax=Stieleria maiorica TaxID=2795974 RepID=A0A5B9M6A1_9BACT|nr:hypothetical protein [Stieleria maiorica]QEF96688.1 hypothetical protein Mal15_07160 [Stieleria maiorica]
MHERTQRAVARLLFVFCCAVPTSIVFLSILVTWTPWYQANKLAELTHHLNLQTGLVFEIGRCERVAPGKYILENVRVSDPDSRQHVVTVRLIDYLVERERAAIILHQPEFQSAGLGHAWTMLHDRLISRPAQTVVPISILATDVSILSRTGSMPPVDVSAEITPEGDSVRMIARAGHATRHVGPRLHVELFRDRDREVPATELVLSTEGTALPCSALAEYAPAIKHLGANAEFVGVIACRQTLHGWTYDLGSSSLTKLSLNDLTDHLPHRVIGEAEVQFRRCVIHPGESVNLVGTLKSSKPANLRIKTPLLAAMRDHLGMAVDERELVPNPNGIECELALNFDIRDETMTLTGIGDNVVLYSRGRPIAAPPAELIDADRITAMLAPPSRWMAGWNSILLPSSPTAADDALPAAAFRSVRNLDGDASIRQQ